METVSDEAREDQWGVRSIVKVKFTARDHIIEFLDTQVYKTKATCLLTYSKHATTFFHGNFGIAHTDRPMNRPKYFTAATRKYR